MKITSINNILFNKIKINNEIIVKGWVKTRRDSKLGISFLMIQDGSCINNLQVIVDKKLLNYKDILCLTTGCSVKIIGKVINSLGKQQNYELKANKIEILGWVNNCDTYPISSKKHSIEYLREFAHLRPRTNLIGSVTRIRHTLSYIIHKFMNKNGFFWISTPLITTFDSEGAGKIFKISKFDEKKNSKINNINYDKKFFKKEVFLTVSGQLNAESYACALSKIYTFGPTFRAENSKTTRHLAEFWMIEPEIAFAKLKDILIFSEILIKHITHKILIKRYNDILYLKKKIDKNIIKKLKKLTNTNFVKIEYTKAIDILLKSKKKFKNLISWGIDLFSEHECYLTDIIFKKPIIIINYPKNIKPFYMRINKDNKTVAAMDMLLPGIGEIIGGSQREERLEKLDINFEKKNIKKIVYWWYRDLRKYGTVPHAGFGLGFERLILYITGIKNIKDVIPFPRSSGYANF